MALQMQYTILNSWVFFNVKALKSYITGKYIKQFDFGDGTMLHELGLIFSHGMTFLCKLFMNKDPQAGI